MKEFVLKSMRFFRNKDKELATLLKKKTEAINQFIDIMRKWYEEHRMKHQYLGSMRKEYAVDSAAVEECVAKLESENFKEDIKQCVAKLRKYWDWVHLAFLYGNSFY